MERIGNIGNVIVKRGQYLRSYRSLFEDLEFVENYKIITPSLTTISRALNKFVELI